MPRLTQQLVQDKIKQAPGLPATARSPGGAWVPDSSLAGFYLRVWKSGAASYAVKKRIGTRVLTRTVGPVEFLSIDQARTKAAELLSQLDSGVDPLEQKRMERVRLHGTAMKSRAVNTTLGDAVRQFVSERRREPSTVRDILQTFQVHFSDWLSRPIRDITSEEVQDRIARIGSDAAKRSKSRVAAGNHAGQGTQIKSAKWLRALWAWAAATEVDGEPLVQSNPTRVIAAKRLVKSLKRRQTRLEASNIGALLEELASPDSLLKQHDKDLIAFMLFTACRPSEALRLQWSDVDLRNGFFTFRSTKNGLDHRVPFSKSVTKVLERIKHRTGYVLSHTSGATPIAAPYDSFGRATDAIALHMSPSDLRRTWKTAAANAGIPLEVQAACLNHALQSVTAGYGGPSEKTIRAAFEKVDNTLRAAK